MVANRTAGVRKKQKYAVNFYLMLLHCSYNNKSYKLNSTKMTYNKSYKLNTLKTTNSEKETITQVLVMILKRVLKVF